MSTVVRPGRPADEDDVAAICAATAQAGEPQPTNTVDPELVTLVYARPYLVIEPDTSRVLLDGDHLLGYVVGAVDSTAFYRRVAANWSPHHVPRPPGADPELVDLLTHPMRALPSGVESFPSHLHVNLMPAARGGGDGARLIASFVDGLASAGSTGVHVRVARDNAAALRFYERVGFTPFSQDADSAVLVRRIGTATPARG